MSPKSRIEILISSVVLLAAIVVLFLSARGDFRSMTTFPYIFAGVVSLIALRALLVRSEKGVRSRRALAIATLGLALSAPLAHFLVARQHRQLAEQDALNVLGGRTAPEIPYIHAARVGNERGEAIRFGDRVTLVNFWATWCNPCIREIPLLEALWQEHRASGFEVLGVTRLYAKEGDEASISGEIVAIDDFLEQAGATYPSVVAAHSSPAHDAYRIVSLPTSVLIDRQGQVVDYGIGLPGSKRLVATARDLMREESILN